ncbi:MAG: ribbon-helix-helix domain-containing protein [Arcobacter sp.]|uniref:ribbon-helix-helix domain-containing protein n=1 Tax=Arcobacter sp. TaxID=1872629 RepID=UPI003AFFB605
MAENKAGRPIEENPRNVQIKIKVTEDEAKRIDELANKMGMNKSRLIRNLLLGNLEDAEFFQKVGILPLVKNLVAFKDKLKGI